MNRIQICARLGSLELQVDTAFSKQFVLVSGENGAGKTTLLRMLAGLEPATGVLQFGEQVWLDSSAGFFLPPEQRGVGCAWPDAALLPWLSVQQNILLGAESLDQPWLTQLAEQFEILMLLQRRPQILSTGEAQRVALVRAIYRRPAVLLLDEPFSAQAPAIRQRLRKHLKSLQTELAITVLMVSHDAEDARMLADQHWHMRKGKLISGVSNTDVQPQMSTVRSDFICGQE